MTFAQILGEIIIGILIADFMTGIGHWWMLEFLVATMGVTIHREKQYE